MLRNDSSRSSAAEAIDVRCKIEMVDMEELAEETRKIGYPRQTNGLNGQPGLAAGAVPSGARDALALLLLYS